MMLENMRPNNGRTDAATLLSKIESEVAFDCSSRLVLAME